MRSKQRFQEPRPLGAGIYNAAGERSENIIGRAISEARRRKGLSREALCDRLARHGLQIGRTGLYRWESGDSIPNAYQLLAVCQELELSDPLHQLTTLPPPPEALNEAGLKKLESYRQDLIASGRYRVRPPAAPILYMEMPVSALAASAGTGEFLEEDCFEMVRVPAASVPAAADFGVRINGDSMEPVYRDGQLVWIARCDSLREGEVGLFIYDGAGYIKVYGQEYVEDGEGGPGLRPVLISYNEQYSPRPVSPALDFHIVGRVLS